MEPLQQTLSDLQFPFKEPWLYATSTVDVFAVASSPSQCCVCSYCMSTFCMHVLRGPVFTPP